MRGSHFRALDCVLWWRASWWQMADAWRCRISYSFSPTTTKPCPCPLAYTPGVMVSSTGCISGMKVLFRRIARRIAEDWDNKCAELAEDWEWGNTPNLLRLCAALILFVKSLGLFCYLCKCSASGKDLIPLADQPVTIPHRQLRSPSPSFPNSPTINAFATIGSYHHRLSRCAPQE